MTVSIEDIRAAAQRIAGSVERTPCLHSRTLSRLTGAEVWLKFENLQYTASSTERGALNKLLTLDAAARKRGVIAMSAGNHAQGVAYHASRLGLRSVIVMPRGTPNSKVSATRVHGAEVLLEGDTLAEAAQYAHTLEKRDSLTFIHPYDDPVIVAGQGTVALEMLEQAPALEILVVPVGGGGLLSGMATAARALRPDIALFGVESVLYSAMQQRLSRRPVEVGGETIAEGLAVRDVGDLTFAILSALAIEVLLVQEETIERSVASLIEIEKTVAEGAGAAGLAALLDHAGRFAGKRVGLVISGGNIDSRLLASVLLRGLARDGRLVRLRVTLPDVAGSLAKVAAMIGEAGGNIIEVEHRRVFGVLSVKAPEVEFMLETRDREHSQAIVDALAAKGVRATLQ